MLKLLFCHLFQFSSHQCKNECWQKKKQPVTWFCAVFSNKHQQLLIDNSLTASENDVSLLRNAFHIIAQWKHYFTCLKMPNRKFLQFAICQWWDVTKFACITLLCGWCNLQLFLICWHSSFHHQIKWRNCVFKIKLPISQENVFGKFTQAQILMRRNFSKWHLFNTAHNSCSAWWTTTNFLKKLSVQISRHWSTTSTQSTNLLFSIGKKFLFGPTYISRMLYLTVWGLLGVFN